MNEQQRTLYKAERGLPMINILLRGVGPVIEVDGTGSTKLLSTGVTDDSVVAMLLGYGLKDPIIVGVLPHDWGKAWSQDVWIFGSVETGFNNTNRNLWVFG